MNKFKTILIGFILLTSLLFISGSSVEGASTSILVNEVYYDAEGSDSDNEWIELYNPTSSSIDLTGWTIEDNYDSYTLSGNIGAEDFLTIAASSSGFNSLYGFDPDLSWSGTSIGLSNSGDQVILRDSSGSLVDDVYWEGENGWSLTASTGDSLSRQTDSDTDSESDWATTATETPNAINDGQGTSEPDTTPPTISITNPSDGATVGGSVTISTSSSDDTGVDSVEIYIDGSLVATSSSYYWDTTTVSDGSHTIDAIAYDAAGNSGSDSISVIVDNANYEEPSAGEVKIMSYNIEASGANADWKEVIKEENADIVLLIETGDWDDTGDDSVLQGYCDEFNTYFSNEDPYYCDQTMNVPYSTSGEAIMTRYPIVSTTQIAELTLDDGSTHDPSHDFLDVVVDVGDTDIHFIAAHLKCCGGDQTNYDKRIMQQEGIINYMDDLGDVPVVYAGDLNSFNPEDDKETTNNKGDLEYHPMSMMLEDTTFHDMSSSYSTVHTWDDPLTTLYPDQFFPTYGHQNTRYTSRIDFITMNHWFSTSNYIDATVGDTATADTGSDHYSTDITYDFSDGSSDTTAPTQVTGLSATTVSSSQIDLTWDAASDDIGVDHYNIYRDGVQVAESTTTSYSDTGLTASTTYTYEVSAEDAAGNEGALSSSVSATTDSSSDTTPPSQVTGLTATTISSSQIDITWDANSESDLDHYNVYRDGSLLTQVSAGTTSYSDTGLNAGTTYTYEVSAVDTSGNEGTLSDSVSATTNSDTTSTMYVSSIEVFVDNTRGPWRDIGVTVIVLDDTDAAVSGASVTIELETPSGSILTATVTTGSDGSATVIFEKADRNSGTYTATVTDVTASGFTYDPTLNVETSDSVNA